MSIVGIIFSDRGMQTGCMLVTGVQSVFLRSVIDVKDDYFVSYMKDDETLTGAESMAQDVQRRCDRCVCV